MAAATPPAPGGAPHDGPGLLPALSLFPLGTVLFPGGQLSLKVFEPRYLDLMSRCLRSAEAFGVVSLRQGTEVGSRAGGVELEPVGVLAHIEEVDAEQSGILLVRCRGGQRFRLDAQPARQGDGLWVGPARLLPDDPVHPPEPEMDPTVQALSRMAASLQAEGRPSPWSGPARLDDAAWVSNRWCELLPVPASTRQKLMELEDPDARLRLVDGFLRSRGVVKG
ncbi:MAG: LON peptidase substrate-binding domain-containing protein [Rubrivivax sp.]